MECISTVKDQAKWRYKEALQVLFGTLFLVYMARCAVPTPFSPVPLSLQTLGIFLIAGTLGARLAAYSVLAYLAQGTLGLPVFIGGIADPLWFCGLRAGYLVGFAIAAFVVGMLVQRRRQSGLAMLFLFCLAGEAIILSLGALWFALLAGPEAAFSAGVLPFIGGDVAKCAAAALFLRGMRPWIAS